MRRKVACHFAEDWPVPSTRPRDMNTPDSNKSGLFETSALFWFGIAAPERHEEFLARLDQIAAALRGLPFPEFQSEPADFVRVLEANGE